MSERCSRADKRLILQEHVWGPAPNGWQTCKNGCGGRRRRPKSQPQREYVMYGTGPRFKTFDTIAARSTPCLVSLFFIPFVLPLAIFRAVKARVRRG